MPEPEESLTNFRKEMRDITDRAKRDSQELLDRSKREFQERMDRMERLAEELDNKSMQNFASWRDYLHKYFVIVLAFIGGTGVFSASSGTSSQPMVYGVYLALAGLIVGFTAINLYFYFERKWFQISNYVTSIGFGEMHQHPDVEDDPALAARLNIKSKIADFKNQLKDAKVIKDKKKIRHLRNLIRGHKMEMRLMKYLGQQVGWIEKFWVISVALSMVFTTVGIILIFSAIL